MSVFSNAEREYLASQRFGRLATVGSDGTPHVVPTGFRYNPQLDTIDIGGHGFTTRKKYRDVLRNPKVAFVVDDIVSVNPWQARGLEIRGEVQVLDTGGTELGPGFDAHLSASHHIVLPVGPRRMNRRGTSRPTPEDY